MTKVELAKDYQERGWFRGMTPDEIRKDIANMESETLRVDKRTYNGRMTKAFNSAKISIAKIVIEGLEEQSLVS